MHSVRQTLSTAILSTFAFASTAALASPTHHLPAACEQAKPIRPQSTESRGAGPRGTADCYRLDLDEPGVLLLQALSTDPTQSLLLTLLPGPDAGVLTRSAEEALLMASPGTQWLLVSAEDPRAALPSYRLRARFSPRNLPTQPMPAESETDGETEYEPDELAHRSETDGETEYEPDELGWSCGDVARRSETDGETEYEPDELVHKSETDGETEYEPDELAQKSETDGETEYEPDELWTSCQPQAQVAADLCVHAGHGADNASLTCAIDLPLNVQGGFAEGVLDSTWGEDQDVIRFHLDSWRTVEIEASGRGLSGSDLLDGKGQRLARSLAEGQDSLRIVRTLAPGTYFLRLSGWASSPYQVSVLFPGL